MTDPAAESTQLAALDLGSNSFHLLVAQESGGRIQVLDKLKEMVRLAEGLDDQKRLSAPVMDRALACLERFGQRLRALAHSNVRIVGTNTLRQARNADEFLARAQSLLGHPIEVISGREEARLIYLGVSHSVEDNHDRRLVVDIGGGSTELIVGRHFEAERTESLYMGCVSISRQHFADGRIRQSHFKAAINDARQELVPVAMAFDKDDWSTAIGASGTILAAQQVIAQLGSGQSVITLSGLEAIREMLLKARRIDAISIAGLPAERAPVFPGGLAILIALFKSLQIDSMQAATGALREGLIYDLLGRVQHHDVRESSVRELLTRYRMDHTHARRVRDFALGLLAQVAASWDLKDPNHQLLLGWAAELHEIGMEIAHSQYHKHGAYMLQYMDLPGFSRLDQQQLAALVRAHRRKFPIEEGGYDTSTIRLAVLLRIAVVMHRSRSSKPLPHVVISAHGDHVALDIPQRWLNQQPLTRLDLEEEAQYLTSLRIRLTINKPDDEAASVAG